MSRRAYFLAPFGGLHAMARRLGHNGAEVLILLYRSTDTSYILGSSERTAVCKARPGTWTVGGLPDEKLGENNRETETRSVSAALTSREVGETERGIFRVLVGDVALHARSNLQLAGSLGYEITK